MRGKVAEHFVDHVMEGGKILVHGESRVVQEALCHAAKSGKDFEVRLFRFLRFIIIYLKTINKII